MKKITTYSLSFGQIDFAYLEVSPPITPSTDKTSENLAHYNNISSSFGQSTVLPVRNEQEISLENLTARPGPTVDKLKTRLIGIPTFEGYEFVSPGEIIRCEGLQKCTRVVIMEKRSIVSSYNIGEFEKLLAPYDFFFCHKSHLINLNCIHSYSREGTLVMCDRSVVPVSRRKKKEFLTSFSHI